jgi:multidrug efflux pump subunit AcrA (membrane-fusion protein)
VNDKIDRLAELRIERDPEPSGPRRWPVVMLGIIGLAAIVWLGIRVFGAGPVPVTTETVRLSQSSGNSASVLDASGYVVARRQATVSSKITGKVLEVLVEEGDRVQKIRLSPTWTTVLRPLS